MNNTDYHITYQLEASFRCELFGKYGNLSVFDNHLWFTERQDRLEANVYVCKGKRVACYGSSLGFKPRIAVLDSNFLLLFKTVSRKELSSPKDVIFLPRTHSIVWSHSQLVEILTSHYLYDNYPYFHSPFSYRIKFRDSTAWSEDIQNYQSLKQKASYSAPFSDVESLSVSGQMLRVELTGAQPLVFRFDSSQQAQRVLQHLKSVHSPSPLIQPRQITKKGSILTAFEQRFGFADSLFGVWKCRLSESGKLSLYSTVVFLTEYALMCSSNWGTTKIVVPFSFMQSVQFIKNLQGKHIKISTNSHCNLRLCSIDEADSLYQAIVSLWRRTVLSPDALPPLSIQPSQRRLRVKMLIIGTRGDVQPVIPLALKLYEAGHQVTVATHELHRSFIENVTGGRVLFDVLPGDPRELMELCVGSQKLMSVHFIRDSASKFRGFVTDLFASCWDVCRHDTDVIITNPPTLGGPVHVAEKLKVPLLVASTFPWTRTEKFPHPFAVPKLEWGAMYNYVTYILVEHGMWLPIRSQSNEFRKRLGLEELSGKHSLLYERQIPTMYCWSSIFVPKPLDWPSHVEVTGYWFQHQNSDWEPPQELLQFLSEAPKPIYIGFGSVTVENPDKLTKIISEALNRTKQRAVILKGWGGLANFNQDNIYVIDFAPHEWLFPHMQGIIHHGGAGTCAASLQAGVPSLVVPFFGDQFFWGHQMLKSGAGIAPIQVQHLTVERLCRAIMELIGNPALKIKAQAMSQHIQKEDGVNKALQFFQYHTNN